MAAPINHGLPFNVLQVEVERLGHVLVPEQHAHEWHAVLTHRMVQGRERELVRLRVEVEEPGPITTTRITYS